MRVRIHAYGHARPYHHMNVDGYGIPIDLTQVAGSLHDPTITDVEWEHVMFNGEWCEGGKIYREGDPKAQEFFDYAAIAPYLEAYERRKAELLHALPA